MTTLALLVTVFTNIVEKMDIKTLAESDEHESVKEVLEVFSDYIAVNHHVFSFNIPACGDVTICSTRFDHYI